MMKIRKGLSYLKDGRGIYFGIGAVVILGMVFRFLLMLNHFTHVDDVGVAISIIDFEKMNPGVSQLGRFEAYKRWTYAPLQFIIHALTVDGQYSYFVNLILGRLPSFCFGCFNILLAVFFVKRMIPKKEILLMAAVLIAFSWEHAIYSAQMEPYSIGVFFTWIALFLFTTMCQMEDEIRWKKAVFVPAILMALACYAQYQMFMVVFVLYISLFLCYLYDKKYKRFFGTILASLLNLLITVPMLLIIKQFNMLDRGVNWNAGIHGEFSFDMPASSFISKILYIAYFFVGNLFRCIKYFFVPQVPLISNVITLVLFGAMCIGFVHIHIRKWKLVYFIDIYAILFLLMVGAQKLTFGPSRHLLVFYPVWLVLICIGFFALEARIDCKKFCLWIRTAVLAGVAILFVVSFPKEYSKRINYMTEDLIQDVINVYEPNIIMSHAWAFDLYLMTHFEHYENKSLYNDYGLLHRENSVFNSGDRIVFVSRTVPVDETNFTPLWQRINEALPDQGGEHINSLNDLSLYKEYDITSEAEVEYASEYYENYKNGLKLQVYIVK